MGKEENSKGAFAEILVEEIPKKLLNGRLYRTRGRSNTSWDGRTPPGHSQLENSYTGPTHLARAYWGGEGQQLTVPPRKAKKEDKVGKKLLKFVRHSSYLHRLLLSPVSVKQTSPLHREAFTGMMIPRHLQESVSDVFDKGMISRQVPAGRYHTTPKQNTLPAPQPTSCSLTCKEAPSNIDTATAPIVTMSNTPQQSPPKKIYIYFHILFVQKILRTVEDTETRAHPLAEW